MWFVDLLSPFLSVGHHLQRFLEQFGVGLLAGGVNLDYAKMISCGLGWGIMVL